MLTLMLNDFFLVHVYNYYNHGWKKDIYPITRFASEYGYQSLPSLETLKSATNDSSDLKYTSDFLKHRQRSVGGHTNVKRLMQYEMLVPSADKTKYLQTYIYYSQVRRNYLKYL